MIERRIRYKHIPGVAEPEASWDDLILRSEMVTDDEMDTLLRVRSTNYRHVLVTAEFMRDAEDALMTVAGLLDDRSR